MNHTRLFEIPDYQLSQYPQEDCLVGFEDGAWRKYSTQEVIQTSDQFGRALIAYGIQPGEKIAIISNNRPEYNLVDLGTLKAGAIDVPMYPTISAKEYEYIMNDAEIRVAFVSDAEILERVLEAKKNVPSLSAVYTFDKVEGAEHWSTFLALGDGMEQGPELEARKEAVKGEDLATLIYTSGTTGLPKGVMLSHKNILSNLEATLNLLPVGSAHRSLSFLPLCHIFERMVSYTYMTAGCSIYYAKSLETIGDDLKEIKPHFFSSVPRLLEKVFDKIMAKGEALSGIKKKLFFWAVGLGMQYKESGNGGLYGLKLGIARKLIFSKWQEALGGNIIGIVTGAAALQERLGRIFNAAGIAVREGYGLTETSPVLSFNQFSDGNYKFGSVGVVLPNVEIKIAEDGEILAKGPNVMMGYYNKPEATAEVIKDEWFHTGDIGMFVEDKFLKITDRKKELFKTSGGKYVAPQPLENKFKESPLIEQIMVVGNDKHFVAALVVPNPDALRSYCQTNNLGHNTIEEMVGHKKVEELFQSILDKYNPEFSKVEQIKKVKLMTSEWTVETGELTPTMKIKRKVIMEKYAAAVEEIYS